jgi:hypothetical protein
MKAKGTHRSLSKELVTRSKLNLTSIININVLLISKLFLTLLILVFITLFIYISTHDNEEIKSDVLSSLVIVKNIKLALGVLPKKILNTLDLSDLDSMYIEMSPKNYQRITNYKNNALNDAPLTHFIDPIYKKKVRALIKYKDNNKKEVTIRLKGDNAMEHLNTSKWSMRVDTIGNDKISSMTKFALQHPQRRSYIMDFLLGEILRAEGNMSIIYELVPVYINGSYKGVYNIEEVPGINMVDKFPSKEGVIVEFDEENIIRELTELRVSEDWRMVIKPKDQKAVLGDAQLRKDFLRAAYLITGFQHGELKATDVFDKEKLSIWLAMQDLTGATHGLTSANVKFFYDRNSDKISPIAWDSHNEGMIESEFANGYYRLNSLYLDRLPLFWSSLFNDKEILESYFKALHKVTEDGYLDNILSKFDKKLSLYMKTLQIDYPQLTLDLQLDLLRSNIDYIRRVYLYPKDMFASFIQNIDTDISVTLKYLKPVPLQIVSLVDIETGNEYFPDNSSLFIDPVFLDSKNSCNKPKLVIEENIIKLNFLNPHNYVLNHDYKNKFIINYKVIGGKKQISNVYPYGFLPNNEIKLH